MSSQFNSPREMFERSMYVLHVGIFVAASLAAFGGVATLGMREAVSASLLFVAAIGLRLLGHRYLRFGKIERELRYYHPYAHSAKLSEQIIELERLFDRLENTPLSWRDRLELRRRITGILRQDERLPRYFWKRITVRHPYLLNAL